jgi:hypothetical protein
MELEEGGIGLFQVIIPLFACKDWGKSRKTCHDSG